jgi:hypothetical protein
MARISSQPKRSYRTGKSISDLGLPGRINPVASGGHVTSGSGLHCRRCCPGP